MLVILPKKPSVRGIPDDLIQYMGRGWASLTFQRYFIYDTSDKVEMDRALLA